MPSFSDILLRARNEVLVDYTEDLQIKFYRLYLLALNQQLEKVSPLDVQSETDALQLVRRVILQMGRYSQAAELETKRAIIRIMQRGVRAHKDALAAAIAEAGVNISMSFVGVSKEAFESLFIRREMGLTSSYKSLSVAQIRSTGRTIEKALERMVLKGDSWQRATQRIIDGLTTGDDELRKMAKSMARQSRGLGNWLENATDEADLEAIKAARKIAYDARRIARTEVAHAFHEADRAVSARSPVVKGIQWNLSPRHPEPDICDVYALTDFHGMGPGVYPPEYLPPLPHPHDLCFMTHVLWAPGEWRKPHPPPQAPATLKAADVTKHMPDATPKAIGRTLSQINSTSLRLTEVQK